MGLLYSGQSPSTIGERFNTCKTNLNLSRNINETEKKNYDNNIKAISVPCFGNRNVLMTNMGWLFNGLNPYGMKIRVYDKWHLLHNINHWKDSKN